MLRGDTKRPGTPNMSSSEEPFSTTLALIRQHKSGDKAAFAALFDRHAPAVRRSVGYRIGRRVAAVVEVDDLMQETFLSAWKTLESEEFEGPRTIGGFRNMLVKIAVNKLNDEARWHFRERRDVERTMAIDELAEGLAARVPRPSQYARANEIEALREQAIMSLPEPERLVLDCRDNLGLAYEDVARELGCSYGNARLRYSRAKKRLRELMTRLLD